MQKHNTKLLNYIRSSIILILMISVFGLNALPFTEAQSQPQSIAGIGYYANPGECTDPEGNGSSYILRMTGDLQGCQYVFVEYARCLPNGVYMETGTETFVGNYGGGFGSLRTQYRFEAKYKNCTTFVEEHVGRCQHPVIRGSGTGVFEGVTGRLDMKDNVEEGSFPYRGHLFW